MEKTHYDCVPPRTIETVYFISYYDIPPVCYTIDYDVVYVAMSIMMMSMMMMRSGY